jgi:hypothetical protein
MDHGVSDFFITLDSGFADGRAVAPSWTETFKASFTDRLPVAGHFEEMRRFSNVVRDESYDAVANIPESHLPYYDDLVRAKNQEHMDFLIGEVDLALERDQIMADGALTANIAGDIPSFLIGFIPGLNVVGGASKLNTAMKFAAAGFVGGATSEIIREPFQVADADFESTLNIAASTALSPVLGMGLTYAKPLIKSTVNKVIRSVDGEQSSHIWGSDGSVNVSTVEGSDSTLKFSNPLSNDLQKFLADPAMPEGAKSLAIRMSSNASIATKGNMEGKATQSLAQRILPYYGVFNSVQRSMRDLHAQDIGIGEKASSFAGVFYRNNKEYNAWLADTITKHVKVNSGNPRIAREAAATMTDSQKNAAVLLEKSFKEIGEDATFFGVFPKNAKLKERIDAANKKLDEKTTKLAELEAKIKSQPNAGATKKQFKLLTDLDREINKIRDDVDGLQGLINTPPRRDFAFPIYYDKKLLLSDEGARERLTAKFDEWYTIERNNNPDPKYTGTTRADAERTVAKILEEDADEFENLSFGGGSTKHLKDRKTNIPEWMVEEFIIKDEDALYSYFERMGKKIAFAETYGGRTIDEVMDAFETELRKGKLSEDQILSAKAAMVGDYDRVMGNFVKRPDRWDNQLAKAVKSWTGWTYLGGAGVSAITDVGSIVLAHGYKDVAKAGRAALDDTGFVAGVFRQANLAGELLDISRNVAAREILSDNVKRIQPNMLEKATAVGNKVYYTMNGLMPVTVTGKLLDQMVVQNKFFKLSQKWSKGTINATDREYLARYGIDEEMAKIIADAPVTKHQSEDFVFSNTDAWARDTPQQRAAVRQYQAAIASHSNNTIIMATTFDKPRIMDGVMYMKDNSYFQQMRKVFPKMYAIDKRASTGSTALVRMDSQLMTLPFTFMNFAFGANNKIIGSIADPSRAYRLQGVSALLGMSYLSLMWKDQSWWKDADSVETMARVVDHSGILGVYSDIGYRGLAMAVNTGMMRENASPIPPKWISGTPSERQGDAIAEVLGAPAGLGMEYYRLWDRYLKGDRVGAAKDLGYSIPFVGLPLWRDDARDFFNAGRR